MSQTSRFPNCLTIANDAMASK
jgi:hypothetical protein